MPTPIQLEGSTATFVDSFDLNTDIDEILEFFECSYRIEACELPRKVIESDRSADLKRRLEESFPHVRLTNETARRDS